MIVDNTNIEADFEDKKLEELAIGILQNLADKYCVSYEVVGEGSMNNLSVRTEVIERIHMGETYISVDRPNINTRYFAELGYDGYSWDFWEEYYDPNEESMAGEYRFSGGVEE